MMRFRNANAAFENIYNLIHKQGYESETTLKMDNISFYIENPMDNIINAPWRNFNTRYAEREWAWYLSKDRSVKELIKYAPIWDRMHDGDYIVNSNYGYQWSRNNQLEKVIAQLQRDPGTRQAYITIFDGKEKHLFSKDTPCTNHIGFVIVNGKLCMNVVMRSNDLWFGFCNDQYNFSKLQKLVADELGLPIGWYYHLAHDMHIYKEFINRTPIIW